MKKLLLLTLVLLGGVMQVSATILHIGMEYNTTGDIYIYRFASPTQSDDDWNDMGANKATFEAYKYGRRWYTYDIGDYTKAIVRFDNWTKKTMDIVDITGDNFYIYVANNESSGNYYAGNLANPYWNGLTIQNSLDDDGWSLYTANMVESDDHNTFTRTFTKSYIDEKKGSNNSIWFRFKHPENQFFDESGNYKNTWLRIYPSVNNTEISLCSNTTTYVQGTDAEGNNAWKLDLPSYDYSKIVITATYFNDNGYKWKISADAYITVSVSNAGYATFSYACPLDLTEVTGFDAYVASGVGDDNGSKYVQMNKVTDAVPAETGLLLVKEGGCTNVEVPVAASAEAPTNLLVATVTEKTVDASTTGAYHYFLANGANGIGFYNLASSATSGANKAYLSTTTELTSGSTSSKVAWTFNEDESSEVDAVNHLKIPFVENNAPMYNLAGQRVNNDYKGVVVKNGKKYINK